MTTINHNTKSLLCSVYRLKHNKKTTNKFYKQQFKLLLKMLQKRFLVLLFWKHRKVTNFHVAIIQTVRVLTLGL